MFVDMLIFKGLPCCIMSKSFTYRHDLILHCIVSSLFRVFAESQTIHIYAELMFWVIIYNPCPHCAMHLVSSKQQYSLKKDS